MILYRYLYMCVPRVTILFIIISEAERDKIFSSALTLARDTSKLIYRIPLLEHNVIILLCVCVSDDFLSCPYIYYIYYIVIYMYKSSARLVVAVVVVTGPLSGQPPTWCAECPQRRRSVQFNCLVLYCRLVGRCQGCKTPHASASTTSSSPNVPGHTVLR